MQTDALHLLLEASADASPNKLAVVDQTESLTWGELDAFANQIANTLIAHGVQPGDRVVLRMPKSVNAIAGAYGIMKCGAAYVPLDAAEPSDRSRAAIVDAGATVAIGEPDRKGSWSAFDDAGLSTLLNMAEPSNTSPTGADVVSIDTIRTSSVSRPGRDVSPNELAYILYTSGSTGKRKGVMLRHSNALAFVRWAASTVRLTADDRLSSHAPLHFDLSVFDLYAPALVGATTYLVPAGAAMFPSSLATFIADQRITVWYSVPTILRLLVERGGLQANALPELRTIIFAGEVYPPERLRELMALLPDADYWNWFGPTETNVCVAYNVTEAPPADQPVPIGLAASGAELIVLADEGTRAETGRQGELLVCGPTVHAGYWGDPERTAETIVAHPFDPTRKAFRTGDLVRTSTSGDLLFDGRKDHQIKTRGYRVELGEIEAFLSTRPGVAEAVVVAVPDEQFTHRLHAWVIAAEEGRNDLVRACRTGLASYMIPSSIICVDALPRTLNHKVDRQLLTERSRDL